MTRLWLSAALFGGLSLSPLGADQQLKIERIEESDIPVVHTKLRFTTIVKLPEGEEILEVICGDSANWVIDGKGGVIYMKPGKEGATTNVNVVTKNHQIYSFLVTEISRNGVAKEKPDLKVLLVSDEPVKPVKPTPVPVPQVVQVEKVSSDSPEADKPQKELVRKAAPVLKKRVEKAPVPAESEETKQVEVAKAAPPVAPTNEPTSEKEFVYKDSHLERPPGLIRSTGRVLGHFFRNLSRVFHLY